ncbi:DUF3179 domain-containing protein [Gracilimonas sp.]|uniref:DUF3179 domain-containing protein n=1 Tax=Gracilimonas sp. TaxID=1974203 RepID=UPI003BAC5367
MLKRVHFIIMVCVCTAYISACNQVSTETNSGNEVPDKPDSEWLIPSDEIVDGGPGKDGIPSVDDPQFAPVSEINYIQDDRLVIGLKVGNEVRAYPHQILDWHEIINDEIGNNYFSVTYCPLTGTGVVWDRVIEEDITEFGVSGLLFRNNLIAYDRNTDTHYSQMQIRGVKGPGKGETLNSGFSTVQTTWKTWKSMYPESEVVTRETGFGRYYSGYTYGESYLTDDDYILFPVKHENDRLPAKTVVHAYLPEDVTGNPGDELEVRVFVKKEMSDEISVINEDYAGNHIVAAGSRDHDFVVTFRRELADGTILDFEPVQNQLPIIMSDSEGNSWNIFGEAVSGPRAGEMLTPTKSYDGYWFAVADMFPNACVYPSTGCKGYVDR